MEDEVFVTMAVPDLSHPPPGWAPNAWSQQASNNYHHQQARGRGGNGGGHPTRVIRRTDLRARGAQGGGHRQQRPPRFSNLQEKNVEDRRKSWGEEWKPEPEEEQKKPDNDLTERLEVKEEAIGEEGEWKEVKGRRWAKNEEPKKTPQRISPVPFPSRKKTPEPHAPTGKRRSPESRLSHRKSPDTMSYGKMSPEFPRPGKRDPHSGNRKSPEQYQRKSSDLHEHRKSPQLTSHKSPEIPYHRTSPEIHHNRKSPEIPHHRTSPEIPHNRKSPEITHHKKSPENNRRGSNSSNEGEKSLVFRNKRRSPTFEERSHTRASPPPRLQDKKPDYRISEQCPAESLVTDDVPEPIQNPPTMLLLSDLPDEKLARSVPLVKELSELEISIRDGEAQLKVQKEIVSFLMKNWLEVSNELKETEHEWPPRVAYYSNQLLF